MKKFILKAVSLAMIVVSIFTCACTTPVNSGDPSKANALKLRVFTYNGGVGSAWLYALEERFEEDYEDVVFEDGKVGVDIEVDPAKNSSVEARLNLGDDIVFCEIVNYPGLVGSGKTVDITDIFTTPLNVTLNKENVKNLTDDTRTIEQKLYDEQKDFLQFSDGHYYAVPHYSYCSSIIYNKQLFDDYQLYFAATPRNTGNFLKDQFVASDSEGRSCGPDGVKGNADDGLPATWEEMWILSDWMIKKGVTPFTYAGEAQTNYLKYLLNSAYLNLAGKDQARYNYTYNSNGNKITIMDDVDKGTTKQVAITESNYKDLYSEQAKYQTIQIAEKILDTKGYLHADAGDETITMLRCQEDFIKSYSEGEPIGMLFEGSYWYNEADDAYYFDDARDIFPDFDDRNEFCIMPLPRVYTGRAATDVQGKQIHKTVVADQPDSFGVINKELENNPTKLELAKTFLAYCYTDESLAEFTKITRTVRCLKYDVDIADLDGYAENIWDFYQNSDILFPYSSNTLFLNHMVDWSMHINYDFWTSPNGSVFDIVKGEKTAADFFKKFMER